MSKHQRLPASKVRERFSEIVSRAAYGGEPTIIERSGKPVAALVSMGDLETMEALEDLMDGEEAQRRLRALAEGSDDVMSAEDFNRELDRDAS